MAIKKGNGRLQILGRPWPSQLLCYGLEAQASLEEGDCTVNQFIHLMPTVRNMGNICTSLDFAHAVKLNGVLFCSVGVANF